MPHQISSHKMIFAPSYGPSSLPNAKHPTARKVKVQGRKPAKKRGLTFLDLPGEIRTKIYELSFPLTRALIVRAKPEPKNCIRTPNEQRHRLYHKTLTPRGEDHSFDEQAAIIPCVPLNLVLASSQIYKETVYYLYSNTQFIFQSDKALKRFVLKTPCASQAFITSLEIHHTTNGEPLLTFNRHFKLRGDIHWERMCRAISWTFPSLKELYFDLRICDWPIRLTLDEEWARPILYFTEKKVEYAEVNLKMRMFENQDLKDMAVQLERELMTQEGQEKKEERKWQSITKGLVGLRVLQLEALLGARNTPNP